MSKSFMFERSRSTPNGDLYNFSIDGVIIARDITMDEVINLISGVYNVEDA